MRNGSQGKGTQGKGTQGKGTQGSEQRVERRASFDIQVGVSTPHRLFVGLSANISTGGLFVATDEALGRGDAIEVRFQIPGLEHVFQKQAEVAWTRPFDQNGSGSQAQAGAGVRLLDLSNEEKRMLNAFIDAHDPMFFDV